MSLNGTQIVILFEPFFSIAKGKITCANVLSDLYAMGVLECDNMLMLLGISTKMTDVERDVVVPLIMRGFKVRLKISSRWAYQV